MTSQFRRSLVAATAAAAMIGGTVQMAQPAQADVVASSIVAQVGSTGAVVKAIQTDLLRLGYYTKAVDGRYGPVTKSAVATYQKAKGLKVTGVVDSYTHKRIHDSANALRAKLAAEAAARKAQAEREAAAKKAAAAKADATIFAKPGQTSERVKGLQTMLYKLGYLTSDSRTGYYGSKTTAAVKSFQSKNRLKVTGVMNMTTYYVLRDKASRVKMPVVKTPTVKLDSRCMTGRTICINKGTQRMYWVINGSIKGSWAVRTGRPSLATRSGVFSIYLKSTNWHSTLYDVDMPYTQFFSGGQAVHYSAEFARIGHSGAGSHGCVNMNSMSQAAWLYGQTRIGDKVVVY